MPSQTKSLGPNRRVATGSKGKSKIYMKAMKELSVTQANMRHVVDKVNHKRNSGLPPDVQFPSNSINIGQLSAKEVNSSMAKGATKSNHVPASKGMKQPTISIFKKRFSVEEPKALSRSTGNGKAKLKDTNALKRKEEVNAASRPTYLKAMPGLVPKTTDRLGHCSDLSSQLKKQYSTMKLEFSKGIHMAPKDAEGNNRNEIVNDKKNVKFGEYHEGDTTKATHTLDSTLLDIHCNLESISLDPIGRDFLKSQRDNHSMNLTLENAKKRGPIERNINSKKSSKKRKEPLPTENPETLDDDSNVGVQVDNMRCKKLNKFKQSRVTRKDEAEDDSGDLNHVGVEDDTTSILKNDPAKVLSSCVGQQCYSCSKPIDKPIWSGIFKTEDNEYASLDGHLSTKSCEKAWSLSRQLHQMVEVKKVLRLEVWPKAWDVSKPIADDVAIYFFPHEMRQDEGLDELVREVMQNDLALRAIIGEAELLILPSILLPHHHQTFQGKHYLWGVFKRREDKGVVVEEPLNVAGHWEMEKQENVVSDQPNHMLPSEEPDQDMIRMESAIPLERQMLPPNKSTQDVEASRLKGPSKKGFDLKAPGEEGSTHATTFPASYGQITPSMGHTPDKLMGFVVRKTPKLEGIIRELEQEGALVIAIQGEMFGAGSTAMQK